MSDDTPEAQEQTREADQGDPKTGLGPSRREILPWSIIAVTFTLGLGALFFIPVTEPLSGKPEDAVEIAGELFLDGPERKPFKTGAEAARKVCEVLARGEPANDGKWPGRAAFAILYKSGAEDKIEVTTEDLVRINGRPLSVDAELLLGILEPLVNKR